MDSLEDLVTGNLAPEEAEENASDFQAADPLEIINNGSAESTRITPENLDLLCQSFSETIAADPSRAPYLAAQILAYLRRMFLPGGRRKRSSELLILATAIAYSKDSQPEHLQTLQNWSASLQKEIQEREFDRLQTMAISGTVAQIDFLGEFFGDDTTAELVYMTGVKTATARRWVQGGNMSWANGTQIKMLAKIFYALRHRQNMSNSEAVAWYRTERPDCNRSPRELMKSFNYAIGADLREAMNEIGMREEH